MEWPPGECKPQPSILFWIPKHPGQVPVKNWSADQDSVYRPWWQRSCSEMARLASSVASLIRNFWDLEAGVTSFMACGDVSPCFRFCQLCQALLTRRPSTAVPPTFTAVFIIFRPPLDPSRIAASPPAAASPAMPLMVSGEKPRGLSFRRDTAQELLKKLLRIEHRFFFPKYNQLHYAAVPGAHMDNGWPASPRCSAGEFSGLHVA